MLAVTLSEAFPRCCTSSKVLTCIDDEAVSSPADLSTLHRGHARNKLFLGAVELVKADDLGAGEKPGVPVGL